MRIGIVTPFFYPFDGGAERLVLHLAEELAKKHEVDVFTSDRKGHKIISIKEEKFGRITINRCTTYLRYGSYFSLYPSLILKLASKKLDVVHVYGVGFLQQEIAAIVKKIISPRTKFFVTPIGPFMALSSYEIWQAVLKRVYMPLLKLANNVYGTAIALNPYQKFWFKDYRLKNFKLIPCGILAKVIAKKTRQRSDLAVCYLGRVQKYKGIDQVIKVLPDLKKKFPQIKFFVVGPDAGDLSRLSNLAKELSVSDRVIFTGEVSEEEKFRVLDKCSIFIFPSEWEAFGIATLEAMARGLPIISTKTEGGRFLVEDGVNGYLFEFNNLMELKEKLTKLLSDGMLCRKIAENNIAKAKKFIWSDLAEDLEKVYEYD